MINRVCLILLLFTGIFYGQDFWDDYYSRIEFTDYVTGERLLDHYHYNSIENAIIPYLVNRNRDASILDVGSGAGHWIKFSQDLLVKPEITVIDISSVCIEKLKTKFGKNIDYIKADFGDSLILGKYGLVFVIGILHHITGDNEFQQALKNIYNSLNDGGLCFIATEFSSRQFKSSEFLYKKYRTLDEWKDRLNKANLHIVNIVINQNDKLRKTPNSVLIVRKMK